MNWNKYLFIIIICTVILSSCKTITKTTTAQPAVETTSTNELFAAIQAQELQFSTISARLNVALTLPGNSLSSRVDLKILRDSALLLSVQPLLGIEVFRIKLTPDSVKAIDRLNHRYFADNYANMKGKATIDFNFYNLQALFTNRPFFPGQKIVLPSQFKKFDVTKNGTTSELSTKDAMNLLYTFIISAQKELSSTRIVKSGEETSLTWDYSDFQSQSDKYFPMLMNIALTANGNPKGQAAIRFSRIQLNQPISLEFNIPSTYTRITFSQLVKSVTNK